MEGLLRDAEEVGHLLQDNVILVFGEVVLERHEVTRLLEAEGEFLGDEKEVVIVNLLLFGLLLHRVHEGTLYPLVFDVLTQGRGTLLSEIQTSLFGIGINC